MRTPEQRGIALTAIIDQVLAAARHHEEEAHGGELCGSERLVMLATIIAALGLKAGCDAAWAELRKETRDIQDYMRKAMRGDSDAE